jgi:hypothetical protein
MVNKGYKRTEEHQKHLTEFIIKYYLTYHSYWKGRKQPESTIKKRSISLKRYYSNHVVWNKNKEIHSEATRQEISESYKH